MLEQDHVFKKEQKEQSQVSYLLLTLNLYLALFDFLILS